MLSARNASQIDFTPDGTPIVVGNGNAGGLPLFAYMEYPFDNVQIGFLSVTNNNGLLSGDVFIDAYNMLVQLQLAGSTSILSMTDYDTEVSANGTCNRFGLDVPNKKFKIPYIPLEHWYGNTRIGNRIFHENLAAFGTGSDRLRELPTPTEDCFYRVNANSSGAVGYLNLYVGKATQGLGENRVACQNSHNANEELDVVAYVKKGQRVWVEGYSTIATTGDAAGISMFSISQPLQDVQIKLYGTLTNQSQIDMANLVTQLSGKLDTSIYDADEWKRLAFSVKFDGTTGSIISSKNVSSVTRTAVGVYDVVLSPALAGYTYIISGSCNATAVVVPQAGDVDSGSVTIRVCHINDLSFDTSEVYFCGFLQELGNN